MQTLNTPIALYMIIQYSIMRIEAIDKNLETFPLFSCCDFWFWSFIKSFRSVKALVLGKLPIFSMFKLHICGWNTKPIEPQDKHQCTVGVLWVLFLFVWFFSLLRSFIPYMLLRDNNYQILKRDKSCHSLWEGCSRLLSLYLGFSM